MPELQTRTTTSSAAALRWMARQLGFGLGRGADPRMTNGPSSFVAVNVGVPVLVELSTVVWVGLGEGVELKVAEGLEVRVAVDVALGGAGP